MDASGIPGFDKVDALAMALMECNGLAVNGTEVKKIKNLYDQLEEYDKRPILFKPRCQRKKNASGRFKKKNRSGYKSIETMKRLHFRFQKCTFLYS